MYKSLQEAFDKALARLETEPSVTISVTDHQVPKLHSVAQRLIFEGYKVYLIDNSITIYQNSYANL